jgi:hypothetical protein
MKHTQINLFNFLLIQYGIGKKLNLLFYISVFNQNKNNLIRHDRTIN